MNVGKASSITKDSVLLTLSRREKTILIILLFSAGLLLVVGWKLFWFMTDDAYISFRYIQNHLAGYGYVWNLPPFKPVEGYSNFLWMLLLEGVWKIFGILPPVSANYITLIFSFLTLLAGSLMVLRIQWSPNNARYRMVFLALVLLGVLTNRTFLAWTSSGLETALFIFIVTLWIYGCFCVPVTSRWWVFLLASCGTLTYLTRPDGMLFAAATVVIFVFILIVGKKWVDSKRFLSAWPLLLIPIHLLWRKSFYGEWLPNTYYAKYIDPWPQSGIRYFLSFILEYALWFWIALFVLFLIQTGPSLMRNFAVRRDDIVSGTNKKTISIAAIRAVACMTLLMHLLYYTLIIGGDHFEYRIYGHLILLIFISMAWLLNATHFKTKKCIGIFVVFILLSYPVPWTHWALTHRLKTREQTGKMFVPISPHWPMPVRQYAETFDDLQYWLIQHFVCLRHQEHKICHEWMIGRFPPKIVGEKISSQEYPIMLTRGTGVPGWVLPNINIIDLPGLNDYIIARTPYSPKWERLMAHARRPPVEYLECLRPNVWLHANQRIEIRTREVPVTAETIKQCQEYWIEKMQKNTRD